jgi:hypothetical protein
MHRAIALLVLALSLACRTQQMPPSTPPLPATTPPPPPERPVNLAHVAGRVVDVTGLSVDGALVRAWGASSDCRPAGDPVVVTSGASGEFSLAVERGVGPAESGCVVIEARAGSSVERVERPVLFARGKEETRNRIDLDRIYLPRAPILTHQEAERLIGVLTAAIRGDREAEEELDHYVRGDRFRVHAALDAYRSYLRGVSAVHFVDGQGASGGGETQWMKFKMTGVADRSVTTSVHRETLVELHGPLIDYGDRASAFVRRIIDAAHQGYPEQMARVLTADDEEISLATAQAVIDRLRSKFDLPRASAVLVYVDEPGNALHYRVSGPSRDGTQEQEILVVGYGDGLVGLRGY